MFVEYDENVDPLVEWCADGLVSDWWMCVGCVSMFVDCIEIVAGLRIALGRVRGKVLCGSLPVSLFYTWRAVGSPIAGGLQADLGLHWDCCGILDWDPAILSQWDDGRPAWPGLVLYMAGRWFSYCD